MSNSVGLEVHVESVEVVEVVVDCGERSWVRQRLFAMRRLTALVGSAIAGHY